MPHADDYDNDAIPGLKRVHSGIANWPEDERPRERLLSRRVKLLAARIAKMQPAAATRATAKRFAGQLLDRVE